MYTPNERIKDYRELILQLTQEDFAKETGLELERVKKIEAKKIQVRVPDVKVIAERYNISTDYLFGFKRFPAPLHPKENEAMMWHYIEELSDEELWDVLRRLGEDLGIDVIGKMPDKSKDEGVVITVCYGEKKVWGSREEAKDFFLKAMAESDGSEHQRYSEIYTKICLGFDVCTDEED